MRSLSLIGIALWLVFVSGPPAMADEFRLVNGNVLRGTIASADEDGLVVRLDVGGFSKREPWVNFSQESLRSLAKDPKISEYVDAFIELAPEELKAREKPKEIVVKDVPDRLERPTPKPGFFAGFLTPAGLLILGVLLLASLYAGYEVALFRHQPVALVCGLSVLLPGLGPILYLALPSRGMPSGGLDGGLETVAPAGKAVPRAGKTTGVVAAKPSSGLALAAVEKPGPAAAHSQPQTYTRGEHTFNRRFFETKFSGFFRVVPNEAERDLVLVFKTARNEYVGRRISRISMNELHLQLQDGSSEVNIPFAEVASVQVRHKDAKG
jgi:hypothetical protein